MDKITLTDAIDQFRAGLQKFSREAPEADLEAMAFIDQSFGPPLQVLASWDAPATSFAESVAALSLAASEAEEFADSPIVAPLLKAALGYLAPLNGRLRARQSHHEAFPITEPEFRT